MTKPTVRIHNLETDQIIDREMTDHEFAEYTADQAQEKVKAEKEAALELAKTTAQAKLAALGLTEDEILAITGQTKAEQTAPLLGGN
jgi:aryl-alcohol dehydrogenase-like predicted oxidoreductase